MKYSTILAAGFLSLGLSGCFDTASTAPSPYNDVKGSALTTSDRDFLAQLASKADAFTSMSKSGSSAASSANPFSSGSARAMAAIPGCTSPTITHEVDWELGDSVATDSFPGSVRNTYDDTTTKYDLAGVNITCDDAASVNAYREVSRQSGVEGDLLTSFMASTSEVHINGDFTNITATTNFASFTLDFTATLKGTVRYTNGFTLEIDTAYFHMAGPLLALDPKGFEAYYHVNFTGYPYSSGLRYDRANDVLAGDIIRGNDRIGTMKVFNDDHMEVKDLDGKLITP